LDAGNDSVAFNIQPMLASAWLFAVATSIAKAVITTLMHISLRLRKAVARRTVVATRGFAMRTSTIGIRKRLTDCAQLMGVVGLLLSSPAFADVYPIRGVWVAHNRDFPIGPNEVCFTVRLSGVEAVARRLISELLIFNENKRYEVKQNLQIVSTLVSTKPADGGYWVTELPDVRRRFWFKQKVTRAGPAKLNGAISGVSA
jgi:hypothetical protein